MMDEWQTVKLGDLCRIELGKTPSRSNPKYWDKDRDTNHVWLSIADLPDRTSALVHDSKEYLSDEGAAISKIVPKGTLLVSFKLTLGRLAYTARDLYTNEAIAALYLQGDSITQQFLYWYLTFFDWQKAAEGDVKVKGKTLNKAKLKELTVLVPPLAEQERIVAILDKAFEGIDQAIAHTEQNLASARELFESYLKEAFKGKLSNAGISRSKSVVTSDLDNLKADISASPRKKNRKVDETKENDVILSAMPEEWQPIVVDEVFEFIDYRGKNPKKSESGHRLITAKNISMGHIKDEPIEYISGETFSKWMTRGFPRRGDVLFVTEGHTMGYVAFNENYDNFATAQRMITLQPLGGLHAKFYFYYMRSEYFQHQVTANATGAAAVGIKATKLRGLVLPFAGIEEMKLLTQLLDNIYNQTKKLEALYTKKLESLKELKQSLLQQAFAGEMTKKVAA